MTHGNVVANDSNLILSTTEIRQIVNTCKSIQNDLKTERRQGIENALVKLERDLREIHIPAAPQARDSSQLKSEKRDILKELEKMEERTRVADIRKLSNELDATTKIYRKLDLTTDLPLDKDMLNLKIKEKMLELEILRRNN